MRFAIVFRGLAFSVLVICLGCEERKPTAQVESPRQEDPAEPSFPPLNPKDPRVPLNEDLARLMTDFGTIMKTVVDRPTWDQAKAKLEAVNNEIVAVSAKLESLPPPTEADAFVYYPRTEAREAALNDSLGSKEEFLGKLSPDVASELLAVQQQFHGSMGQAQVLLRGNSPPAKLR